MLPRSQADRYTIELCSTSLGFLKARILYSDIFSFTAQNEIPLHPIISLDWIVLKPYNRYIICLRFDLDQLLI